MIQMEGSSRAIYIKWMVIVLLLHYTNSEIDFSHPPGVVHTYTGNDVTLTWNFTENLPALGTFNSIKFYYEGYHSGIQYILEMKDDLEEPDEYKGRIQGTVQGNMASFTLSDVKVADATGGNYICTATLLTAGVGDISDGNGAIFIYRKPALPTISPNPESVPNATFTMTCTASSTSIPSDYRPDMKYTWTRNNQPPDRHTTVTGDHGQHLTIDPVSKDDNGNIYKCVAQEEGSTLTNNAEVALEVKYAPGKPVVDSVAPVLEGSSLSVTCTLPDGQEGYPTSYTYYWTNTESGYNKQTISGTLSVSDVTVPLHDGNWTCVVGNSEGRGPVADFQVIVNDPSFIMVPGTVGTHPGQAATMSWLLDTSLDDFTWNQISLYYGSNDGSGQLIYRRILSDEAFTPEYRDRTNVSYTQSNQRITFVMANVQEDDLTDGYLLVILPSNLRNTAQLLLFGPPSDPTVTSQSLTDISEGSRLTLTCLSESSSIPESLQLPIEYSWYRNSGSLPPDRHTATGGQLVVDPVNRTDSAYTCQVNEQGSTLKRNKTTSIDVLHQPYDISFEGDSISEIIHEDSSVTRTCQASCNPPCTYRWQNGTDGGLVNESNVLVITPATSYHTGEYLCVAANDLGENRLVFTLVVEYAPRVTLHHEQGGHIVAGSTVTLICDVDSNLEFSIDILNISTGQSLEPYVSVNQATFIFQHIECPHTGSYGCTATNTVGTSVPRNITINVWCPPQVYLLRPPNGLLEGEEGETVIFEVGVLANPFPTVNHNDWIFYTTDGQEMDIPSNVKSFTLGNVLNLKIEVLTDMNYGNYSMILKNGFQERLNINFNLFKPGTSKSGVNIVAISVPIVVCVVLAAVVTGVVMFYKRRKSKPQKEHKLDQKSSVPLETFGSTPYENVDDHQHMTVTQDSTIYANAGIEYDDNHEQSKRFHCIQSQVNDVEAPNSPSTYEELGLDVNTRHGSDNVQLPYEELSISRT